jgi:hypothetical protein
MAAVVVATLAVIGCGGAGGPKASGGFAELSTQRCQTTAAFQQTPSPPPASVKLPLADSLAEGLVAYVNTGGTTLVGPKGWQCKSAIGADGTEGISVYPQGGSDPLSYRHGSTGQGVTMQLIGGCQGCVADMVCALFPKAKIVREYQYVGCSTPNPTAQEINSVSPSTILFKDGPGVKGQGKPSGGKDPALGAVKLSDRYPGGGASAAQVTCTLRQEQADTCSAMIAAGLSAALP